MCQRAKAFTDDGIMVLLALIPILGLRPAIRAVNKVIHLHPHPPLLQGLLLGFVGLPGLLAIPFFVYSYRAIQRTQHKKITWSVAIFLTIVIFRWGFWLIWWLSSLARSA
jgi:hypothetical protein